MKILVFAPHPDDEILGVGGTMAKLADAGHEVTVCIVTRGYEPIYNEELVKRGRKEAREASKLLGCQEPVFLDIPTLSMNTMTTYEINRPVQRLVDALEPNVVYIPHHGDIHIEHKLVNNAALVACRPKQGSTVKAVYEYEVMSETGWDVLSNTFMPNLYEALSDYWLGIKKKALECYQSQLQQYPNARSVKAIESLAMFRGCTIGVCAAEAFSVVREVC
ncbi:MAG: PIG-L family deacetylase [Oscillospiraceae bacterium]|nr:PIG-L family deacetylase [Oscillospiraceae bacterium]